MRKNANACKIFDFGSEQFLRESFLLCPIHTHVKKSTHFLWFFGKNGEEISYYTKLSLVILVRKQNRCVKQIFSNLMPFFTKKFRKKIHIKPLFQEGKNDVSFFLQFVSENTSKMKLHFSLGVWHNGANPTHQIHRCFTKINNALFVSKKISKTRELPNRFGDHLNFSKIIS